MDESPLRMKCPFCAGKVVVYEEPEFAIAHTVPPCQKFTDEDALVFLRNVRLVTIGPLPDDDQWPIPRSDSSN